VLISPEWAQPTQTNGHCYFLSGFFLLHATDKASRMPAGGDQEGIEMFASEMALFSSQKGSVEQHTAWRFSATCATPCNGNGRICATLQGFASGLQGQTRAG
jgi:hypothetical protein